jgi:SOS-response transcriptional repressor LexA
MMNKPTSPERASSEIVYDYIQHYLDEYGFAPSIRDIALACQLGTTTVVHNLNKLEARGWISRQPRAARGLRLLKGVSSGEKK